MTESNQEQELPDSDHDHEVPTSDHHSEIVEDAGEQQDVLDLDALKQTLTMSEELLRLEKENTLRALAELENFKRRKEQEKQDFLKFANEKLVLELLPVIDGFDLAVAHSTQAEGDSDQNSRTLLEGIKMIRKQIDTFLDKINVSKIDTVNQEFDPNLHQAVAQETREGVAAQTVLKEMQSGYRLHDRVIRPAMVVVSA